MSFWTCYNSTTGKITRVLLDANGPIDDLRASELFLAGNYDTNTKYIYNGAPANRPVLPVTIDSPGGLGGTDNFEASNIPPGTEVSYIDETGTPQFYTVLSDGLFSFGIAAPQDIEIVVTMLLFPYLDYTTTAVFTS